MSALHAQFCDAGVLRLPAAFTADQADAMRAAVWRRVESATSVRQDTPDTWDQPVTVNFKGLKGNRVFAPLTENTAVRSALDAMFSSTGWTQPRPGAQVLLTLPSAGPWVMPGAWHMDCSFAMPIDHIWAVKLFAFLAPVEPVGGGTMVLAGSHRLVAQYRKVHPEVTGGNKETWSRFLKQDPWLAELLRGSSHADGGRHLVGAKAEIAGVPVEVMELTGQPGDVVLTHMHVFHSAAPNTTRVPRQMLTKAIYANGASSL